MRVLLVTGKLAEHVVYDSALQQSGVEFCVKVLPVSVAALLTPGFISRELKGEDLGGYDFVVVPGMIRGDISVIEDALGLPAFKGTRYASDIPVLLEALGRLELSKVDAADSILYGHLQQKEKAMLEAAENPGKPTEEQPWNMTIGRTNRDRLSVGRDFPMRVVAEILDAPTLGDKEILRRARYYVESGARIIDVGMQAGEPKPDEVKRIVSMLKRELRVPISLDTLNPDDIDAGLNSGVDMILSLNSSNIDKIKKLDNAAQVATVVIPDRVEGGEQTATNKSIEERVSSLEKNIEKAVQIGFRKVIADPIMDPLVFPGVTTSILTARSFSERHADVPLLVGVGNVVELLDADSVGVNATMAGIAQELAASLLLTTEGSAKTRGAVRELAIASQMMYLAKRRRTPPKDFGMDLLVLKEKRSRDVRYDWAVEAQNEKLKVLKAKRGSEPRMDPKGFFKVNVDRDSGEVIVSHFDEKSKVSNIVVRGRDPLAIRDMLSKLSLISTLEHAYYLGVEIEKAHVASRINRSYYQDEELFETHHPD